MSHYQPKQPTMNQQKILSKNYQEKLCIKLDPPKIGSHLMTPWEIDLFFPRNLQQDPRFMDPEKTLSIDHSSIATYLVRGPLRFGPIQCLMDFFKSKHATLKSLPRRVGFVPIFWVQGACDLRILPAEFCQMKSWTPLVNN